MSDTLRSRLLEAASDLVKYGFYRGGFICASIDLAIAELDRLEAEPRLPPGWSVLRHDDGSITLKKDSDGGFSLRYSHHPESSSREDLALQFLSAFLTTPDVVPSTEPVQGAGDEALLPCPFCGGEALPHRVPGLGQLWRVTCKNCDAAPHGKFSREGAQAAWNRRAPAEVPDQGQRSQTPMNTETAEICPDCNGSGDAPDGAPWTCLSCGGSGGIETAEKPKPVPLADEVHRTKPRWAHGGVVHENEFYHALDVIDARLRTLRGV